MFMGSGLLQEDLEVYAISPQILDNAAASSAYIAVHDAVMISALVRIGATDITVDAKIEQATAAAGTGVKDVTSAALTQIAANGDDKTHIIDLHPSKLDGANGFCWVRLTITAGDGSVGANVAGFLLIRKRKGASQPADVVQKIKVVA